MPSIFIFAWRMLTKFINPFTLFAILLCGTSSGQDLTGIWKGYFVTKDFSQYKVEFQIKKDGSSVRGFSYSYQSTVFYAKSSMNGRWDNLNKFLQIRELKTVEIKNTEESVTCLMDYNLSYSRSGREEYLEGVFSSIHEFNAEGFKKGQDCGGGKVYLRRVNSSDFYPEPFLQKSVAKKVIVNEAPSTRRASNKATVSNGDSIKSDVGLSAASKNDDAVSEKSAKNELREPLSIPSVSNNRYNDLIQVITVKNPQVQIFLFDNGEIDGDTITVYLNNKLALSKKRLSTTPLTLTLYMDQQYEFQELTMVADNLGKIPPNTALMIIEAGSQRFRVQLTSTEQKNAVVRFRYEK